MARAFVIAVALAMATAALPAGAQGAPEVAQNSTFTVENGRECAANADVRVAFVGSDGVERTVGSTITDSTGHFTFEGRLSDSAPLGLGEITADCGLEQSVLAFDVNVVAGEGGSITDYVPHALGAIAVISLVGFVLSRRAGETSEESPGQEDQLGTSAGPDFHALADASQDHDDDPEYWIWDETTQRGAVKRMACLSEVGFYLHEVPVDEFPALLEQLAADGPDRVLSRAFFAVPMAAVDEVHHRGSQLRLVYHEGGQRLARVIDLGSEVQGVVDLLSRRVHVLAGDALADH